MNKIFIVDLSVFFHVGVTAVEQAQPQRLLISLELEHDFSRAVVTDDLTLTIDYHAVALRVEALGKGRTWKLIETLAWEIAKMAVDEFGASSVVVTVKKFVLPETRYVAVQVRHQNSTPS